MIGAHGDDGNSQSKSGSVYVFTRSSTDNGMFTQQSKLHANDPARDGHFGRSVSLYGDTALIWARYDDDNSKSNSGSVYVFKAPPPPPPSPPPLPPSPRAPFGEGTTVKCTKNDLVGSPGTAAYRVDENGHLRPYPSAHIANSWHPNWRNEVKFIADCKGLTRGADMEKKN